MADKLRVLITGSEGNLGSKLVELNKDYELIGIAKREKTSHQDKLKEYYSIDLTNGKELSLLLDKIKPDYIIHTAALTRVDYCEDNREETFNANVLATFNLVQFCLKNKIPINYISTDYVFDGSSKKQFTEEDRTNPINFYGKTKEMGETAVQIIKDNYLITRVMGLYSWSKPGQNLSFANWVVNNLRENKEIKIANDQQNNPLLTENVAENIYKMIELNLRGIYHLTGRECINRIDFARAIARKFELNENLLIPTSSEGLGQKAKRPFYIDSYSGKADRSGLHIITLEEGLNFLKESEKKYRK